MMKTGLEALTDAEVERALHDAVRRERKATAQVLRCLIEFERRHLHEKKAYGSLFDYCRDEFGYSEFAAYKRTRAAKIASSYPLALDLLESRKIDLARIVTVGAHLTAENQRELLERAMSMPVRELEFFVAGLAPKEAKRDSIRALPAPAAPHGGPLLVPTLSSSPASPSLPSSATTGPVPVPALAPPSRLFDRVEPLSDQLARVAFTADRRTITDIERACDLMGCTRSNLSRVMASAVEALLERIDPDRVLARKRPRAPRAVQRASRRIPQHLRDAVWRRDEGRCAFVDEHGRRCAARRNLEFDHITPWAAGGASDKPENIRLLCRLHNTGASREWFGSERLEAAVSARRGDLGRGDGGVHEQSG